MQDFLGRELSVGDKVVAVAHQRTSSTLYAGTISRFTPKMVVIEVENPDCDWRVGHKTGEERKTYPCMCVKV